MKFLVVFCFACVGLALAADPVSYEGFKVYQITPKTLAEAEALNKFKNNELFDFWSEPRILNQTVTIMVPPEAQPLFEKSLKTDNLEYSILINNLEETVQAENVRQKLSKRAGLAHGDVSFHSFMTHTEMNAYLHKLARTHPDIVQVESIGHSYEGRDMVLIRISSGGSNKPTIFVDAGIHAREWIAPPMALYIIDQLVNNPENRALYQNVDWAIIPSLNPDGYDYTQTSARLWRKTRSPGSLCYGADPNRNFDYYWMEEGASDNECSEIYAGRGRFSEVETRNVRDYILAHNDTIQLYLTFHSYGNYLLYPWGYTSALPENRDELHSLGQDVARAIASVDGTQYTIGSSTNVLYAAAGGSDDWAKGVAGIQLAYCIELPAGGSVGFNPPASRILPIVRETWEGIKVYHDYILNKFGTTN